MRLAIAALSKLQPLFQALQAKTGTLKGPNAPKIVIDKASKLAKAMTEILREANETCLAPAGPVSFIRDIINSKLKN